MSDGVIAVLSIIACLLVGVAVGSTVTANSFREKAIVAGVGQYKIIDFKTGQTEFQFVTNKYYDNSK